MAQSVSASYLQVSTDRNAKVGSSSLPWSKLFRLNVCLVRYLCVPSNNANIEAKIFAPGEARTPDLRISLSVLSYKYDALTDCATRAGTK